MATRSRAKTLKGGKQGVKSVSSKQASGVKGGMRYGTAERLMPGTDPALSAQSLVVDESVLRARKR